MQNNREYAIKIIQGQQFCYQRKANMRLPMRDSPPILHCLQDLPDYWSNFRYQ